MSNSFFLAKNSFVKPTHPQSFPKSEKLCSQNDIQQVFRKGEKHFKFPLRICYYANNEPQNKVLISVPKKMQKLAVNRNLLKRHIREAYRLNKNVLKSPEHIHYNIAFVYLSKDIADAEQIHKAVHQLLKKMSTNESKE
ncbi:MAG: ribonuclease P protein component [Flavobacteriales bacterium]